MRIIINYIESIKLCKSNKDYWLLAVLLVFSSLMILGMLGGIIAIILFLLQYVEIIVGVLCVCGFLAFYSKEKLRERMIVASQSHERDYEVGKNCLYNVIKDVADYTGLVRPQHPNNLNSIKRITHNQGFVILNYDVATKRDVDADAIKHIVEASLAKKLFNREFPEIINTTFIYNGVPYPILMVDGAINMGTFVTINLAFANTASCKNAQAKEYNNKLHSMGKGVDDDELF